MAAGDRFAKLIDIAKENSSERRRELLREITDLFFEDTAGSPHSRREMDLFGDLLASIAAELDREVRAELASRFSDGSAPRRLARSLARDDITVGGQILRNARHLEDEDLIEIVRTKGHEHQLAVSQRETVSEPVSGALVTHGNDEVVVSLLGNQGARLSAETYDEVVQRAEVNPALQGPLVARQTIPPEVLNRLYFIVSGPMRQEILARNAALSEQQVAEAMARAEGRVAIAHGAYPPDYEEARKHVAKLKASGQLQATRLPAIWREGHKTAFQLAFSEIADIQFSTLAGLVARQDVDALAMICRGAGFDRGLFVTVAVLILGEAGMGEAAKLGQMYSDVPVDAAQRALRFFKIRERASAAA